MSGASLMTMVHARLEELRNQLSIVDLNLSIHEAALGWLEYQAASLRVGSARRLEQLIRSDILEPLAKLILKNDVPDNKVVALSFDEDLRRISVRLAEGGPTQVTERMPESPTPSSPSTSYYSFETDDEGSVDVSTEDSLSVDEEEDGRRCQCQSWTPLLPAGPPVLRPLPQKIY
jgi:ATP-dependent Clp protease ATP-binding subunit ClpB